MVNKWGARGVVAAFQGWVEARRRLAKQEKRSSIDRIH